MLVPVKVFAFCFQFPVWYHVHQWGSILRFTPLQPFGICPLQGYVSPGDGLWPMRGGH